MGSNRRRVYYLHMVHCTILAYMYDLAVTFTFKVPYCPYVILWTADSVLNVNGNDDMVSVVQIYM